MPPRSGLPAGVCVAAGGVVGTAAVSGGGGAGAGAGGAVWRGTEDGGGAGWLPRGVGNGCGVCAVTIAADSTSPLTPRATRIPVL